MTGGRGAILGLALAVVACATTPETHVTGIGPPRPTRILALGDSYTIGEGVETPERWPEQLVGLLRDEGVHVADLQVIARTGWTTTELDGGIDAAAPEGPFDLVTLLIGVNNQFRGLDIGDYRAEFVALVERAVGLAGGDAGMVIVLSVPDWGVTPFGARYDRAAVAAEIDAFNTAAEEAARRLGAHFVDVTAVSRRAGVAPHLVTDDGLHPSGAMYAEWAAILLPVARTALGG